MANTTSGDGNNASANPVQPRRRVQYYTQDMDLELRNADAMLFGSGYAVSTFSACPLPPKGRLFPVTLRGYTQPINLYLKDQDAMLLGGGLAQSTFIACQLPPKRKPFIGALRPWLYAPSGVMSPEGAIYSYNPSGPSWSFDSETGDWSLTVR